VLATFYVALQRVLQLISLLCRSAGFKELEIVVLRHDLPCCVAKSTGQRPGRLVGSF
jgi:hypothetical protein